MSLLCVRSLFARKRHFASGILYISNPGCSLSNEVNYSISILGRECNPINSLPLPAQFEVPISSSFNNASFINDNRVFPPSWSFYQLFRRCSFQFPHAFCSLAQNEMLVSDSGVATTVEKEKVVHEKLLDFTKIDIDLLPTVILVGRPNVGKSALFNRLIRRREALVFNTPDDHVTRDIREGIAKLGDLRFRVLDSAGLETEATSGSILQRTASMTANILARTQFAVFLMDVRVGLHPLDVEVGRWLRKHAPGINPIVAMNKSESLCDGIGSIADAAEEARLLGFGDPIAISAETGLGMTALHDALRPLLEDYILKVLKSKISFPLLHFFVVGSIDQMEVDDTANNDKTSSIDSKNNIKDSEKGKAKRKLYVGSQAVGFRRDHMEVLSPIKDGIVVDWDIVDSIWDHAFRECLLVDPKEHPMLLAEPSSNPQHQRERTAELMFEKYSVPALFLAKNAVLTSFASGRPTSLVVDSLSSITFTQVDTAGWLHRSGQEKGPSSLSIMQSRKNLLRAHVVALVLDAEEIAKARRSMTHSEVVIARRAVEEGRGLVVIVNKMDLLKGKQNSKLFEKVMEAVPSEIQTVIPQVSGIPVVFISALEGRGRINVMHQVIDTYEKWCSRLPTSRLNRWLRKVMSRHSWKDQAAQPKIKYFTQVKARPPTFVAFTSGKTQLSDTDLRFLTKSLKEDFDLGGIPIRIMQRSVARKIASSGSKSSQSPGRTTERILSDKRTVDA
ncbi:GTPase Der [Jatropha curcas]|nr:GTPase Der [Jatropha curcas]